MKKSDDELLYDLQARYRRDAIAPPCPVCGAQMVTGTSYGRGLPDEIVIEWVHLDAETHEHFEASRIKAQQGDPDVLELIARYIDKKG